MAEANHMVPPNSKTAGKYPEVDYLVNSGDYYDVDYLCVFFSILIANLQFFHCQRTKRLSSPSLHGTFYVHYF